MEHIPVWRLSNKLGVVCLILRGTLIMFNLFLRAICCCRWSLTFHGGMLGQRWRSSAIAPVTYGAAIDVPVLYSIQLLQCLLALRMCSPGAKMSTHTPALDMDHAWSCLVVAPTVMAPRREPGDTLHASRGWSGLFPAIVTTVMFCRRSSSIDLLTILVFSPWSDRLTITGLL